MSLYSLKINLAEWLLLKVKYPSQFWLGAADQPVKAAAHKKKIILTLLPSHDNLGIMPLLMPAKRFLSRNTPILKSLRSI